MIQRLKNIYIKAIVPKMITQFGYQNKLQVPKIDKVIINRGLGNASQNTKLLDSAFKELNLIAGQKGIITYSKKQLRHLNFEKKWQ